MAARTSSRVSTTAASRTTTRTATSAAMRVGSSRTAGCGPSRLSGPPSLAASRRAYAGRRCRAVPPRSPFSTPPCRERARKSVGARSRPGGLEGVALVHVARIEPGTEPAHPLRGGAVGERFRRHAPSRLLLEAVVADGGGGAQPSFDVTRIEKPALPRVVAPHPGETVRLELHAHGERVAARLGGAAALLRHLPRDAELVLDVVAHLVGDHVGARELAGGTEAPGQILEERAIQVDFVVGGAVEGPHRGAAHATGGVDGTAEEHELRWVILAPPLPEDGAPGVLGIAEDP